MNLATIEKDIAEYGNIMSWMLSVDSIVSLDSVAAP